MAAFHSDTRPILGRGPSILLRFVFFALLSFGLMWLDQRHGYLETVRLALSWAAYPFQAAVNSPGAAWDWLTESFSTRERLQSENASLQSRLREADLRLMRFEALEQENMRLREMREATSGIAEQVMVAEIMRIDLNPYRHRVVLNKGSRQGVFKGQPLLDAKGVFGQITRAGAFTSEAILISDPEHAIPVQVNRNGLRSIALGTGDLTKLNLPFLPINADIKVGDLLVTSGLDDVFPAGYPVAVVTEVNKSQAQTLATISAQPAAALDRDREVLLVWVKEKPIEPEEAEAPAGGAATPGATAPASRGPVTTPPPAQRKPATTPATTTSAPVTQPSTAAPRTPPAETPPSVPEETQRTPVETPPAATEPSPAATEAAPEPTPEPADQAPPPPDETPRTTEEPQVPPQ